MARASLRAGLARNGETETDRRRRVGLRALTRLGGLTADLLPIDAVEIAGRAEAAAENPTPGRLGF